MEQLIMEIQALQEINKSLMGMLRIITSFTFGTWLMVISIIIRSWVKKEK